MNIAHQWTRLVGSVATEITQEVLLVLKPPHHPALTQRATLLRKHSTSFFSAGASCYCYCPFLTCRTNLSGGTYPLQGSCELPTMGASYDEDYSDTESAESQPSPINLKNLTDDALAVEAKAQNLETEEPVKKKKKRRSKKKNKNVRHRIWKNEGTASGAVLFLTLYIDPAIRIRR